MDKEEFTKFCLTNSGQIYVREQKDGKWGSYSLSELDAGTCEKHINRFWEENRMPVLIKELKEQ